MEAARLLGRSGVWGRVLHWSPWSMLRPLSPSFLPRCVEAVANEPSRHAWPFWSCAKLDVGRRMALRSCGAGPWEGVVECLLL